MLQSPPQHLSDTAPPPPRTAMDLVLVDRQTFRFTVSSAPTGSLISDTLTVTNVATTHIAFKVKTTNQERYIVRPNVGLIPPRGSSEIYIALQPTTVLPELGSSRDKFMLRVIEAPELEDNLPVDYWQKHENDAAVRDVKFKVAFVADPHLPSPTNQPSVTGSDVTPTSPPLASASAPAATTAVPHPRDLPPSVPHRTEQDPASSAPQDASAMPPSQTAPEPAVDQLLEERNFDAAIERVRQLQQMLDAKNLELARLKTQLAETNAQTQTVLNDAPKTPLSANKFLSDPFGGVSIAGIGLMLLLFLLLVNVILKLM